MRSTAKSEPMNEDVNAAVRASAARPCCAIGYPSNVVATDQASPGILNRIDVIAPPKSAPQYMHDSITMAEVGSIVKVSGNRMATPFGPPSPGNTPTKMPSTSPTIMRASVFQVSRTTNPCASRPKASMSSVSKHGFERALRHNHVEGDVKRDEHRHTEHKAGEQRFP